MLSISGSGYALASQCYGSPQQGYLQDGWQLPAVGKNFKVYSDFGVVTGRTYVHEQVYQTVVEAYRLLATELPEHQFVYGETGFKQGGKFWPHKTHQNGLSVDFFVPVLNKAGVSVPLPTNLTNKFGYNIEFNTLGQYEDLQIDFLAMASHIQALQQAAVANGISIERVIFDNELQKQLFKLPIALKLKQQISFSTLKPWVRHDEHYHVDFAVPCQLLRK